MIFSAEVLPEKWQTAKLSEITVVNPTLDKAAIADNLDVSFVPMPAVQAESGIIDVSSTRKFSEVKKGYTPFREGDVLFAKITPCMENGKMAVVPEVINGIGFGSTEFHVLRSLPGVDAKFVYYCVSSQSFRREAEHNMSGAVGQRRVTTPYLSECEIPLPPSNEQHRIVAKIEELFSELDKGIEALKTAREQLKVYRQALLKHAFEGKLTAAGERQEKTLGQLLGFLTSGSRGWAAYYAAKGDLFVRAQNIKHDCLELDDVAFVSLPNKTEGLRTRIQRGDLLVTITGANVTKAALVKHELGVAYVSQHVALCRPTEEVWPEFLYWFIVAEAAGRKQLTEMAYGAGKPGLNLENIRSVRVPLPSLKDQQEIVELIESRLSEADQLDQTLATSLQQSEALRQSILKRAFSGQLVAQDPHDESAAVLLARILVERATGGKSPAVRRSRTKI